MESRSTWMLGSVLFVLAAYFWGAIPTAYIAGRVVKGIEDRKSVV